MWIVGEKLLNIRKNIRKIKLKFYKNVVFFAFSIFFNVFHLITSKQYKIKL